MNKSTFIISKMDCQSEEQTIRLALEGHAAIQSLQFDIENRKLEIYHLGGIDELEGILSEFDLGAKRQSTVVAARPPAYSQTSLEKRTLLTVLLINFGFFALEILAGIFAQSMGLLGDALDMLADAFVYGLSLLAVGMVYS